MINLKFNLDPDNQDHMRALAAFAGALTGETNEVTKEVIKEEEVKQVKKTRTAPKKETTPEPEKETEEAKKETEETGVTVEDLRALTNEKVKLAGGKHRAAIKAKLKELGGAENVPQLKKEYYQDYFEYLNSLK